MNLEHIPKDELSFRPVRVQEWDDFQSLFTEPGVQNGCWCMYWRVKRADFHKQYGEAHRQAMKRMIESGSVPGILAYLGSQPVGWCSIAPREAFPVLDRSPTLKRVDDKPVWSIVCFYISKPYRRRGISTALIEAAIDYARENGAWIIEAYPLAPGGTKDPRSERYMGLVSTFKAAGFQEVARRSKKRAIMRYTISNPTE